MTQDYRPTCWWCHTKKLNKKERLFFKETNLPVCTKCNKILTKMIGDSFK